MHECNLSVIVGRRRGGSVGRREGRLGGGERQLGEGRVSWEEEGNFAIQL